MQALNLLALVLVIVGALNWALVGIADFDLVAAIFGAGAAISRIVYVLVGFAGLYCLTFFSHLSGKQDA